MRSALLLICLGIGVLGCAQPGDSLGLAASKGKVTYNGKPVAGAMVTFLVADSPIATGATDANGEFVITTRGRPGAPIGPAKVGIIKPSASASGTPTEAKPEDMRKMQMEQMRTNTPTDTKPEIPIKYSNPDESGLTAEVTKDPMANVFKFELVD